MSLVRKVKRKLSTLSDRIQGYDFNTVELPEVNGLDRKYVNKASPSGDEYLTHVCNTLPITKDDRIIDIGCARGSAMRLFTKYPFSVIGGLELSEKLAGICESNFKKMGDKRVITYNADATQFDQYGEYNYFYLYNPFPTRELLDAVVSQMMSQRKGMGRIHVVYNTPSFLEVFHARGFKTIGEYDDQWGSGITVLTAEL